MNQITKHARCLDVYIAHVDVVSVCGLKMLGSGQTVCIRLPAIARMS